MTINTLNLYIKKNFLSKPFISYITSFKKNMSQKVKFIIINKNEVCG